MGQISVLDRNMINMIAAGEVIERPASVVKELMENSIDAGATKIIVSIEDGGKKLISVADNGCGMDGEDLQRSFEPHSTSKIKDSNDLQKISTLGFRGEALASIGSVAQVKAVSRTKDSNEANCVEVDCGTKSDISICSGDIGTTIQVRDLFYKLPARRKFLRTTNTEMGHITELFTRIALSNCSLEMTLLHNGREIYRLTKDQSLTQRISVLFSSAISENLIETQISEKGLNFFALLGKPSISRTNRKVQYTFLNGRFIRDKLISHAIKEAYRGSLAADRFAVIFLYIQMPYADVDVNVHPTKTEVRFYNSNLVHSQILSVIREKLLASDLQTDGKLPETTLGVPTGQRAEVAEAMAEFFKKHGAVQSQQQFNYRHTSWGYSPPAFQSSQIHQGDPQTQKKFLQIHDSYIVSANGDGFVIVDQHALHERIIYEQLKKRIADGRLESQKLLIPESFQLTDIQLDAIKENSGLLEKLGIELAPFGPKTMAIQGFPVILKDADRLEIIRDLIDLLGDQELSDDAERLFDAVLNMAACKAAIKAGQKLSVSEIEQLLADSEKVDHKSHCPHGRPTTITFSISELEKQFKRT